MELQDYIALKQHEQEEYKLTDHGLWVCCKDDFKQFTAEIWDKVRTSTKSGFRRYLLQHGIYVYPSSNEHSLSQVLHEATTSNAMHKWTNERFEEATNEIPISEFTSGALQFKLLALEEARKPRPRTPNISGTRASRASRPSGPSGLGASRKEPDYTRELSCLRSAYTEDESGDEEDAISVFEAIALSGSNPMALAPYGHQDDGFGCYSTSLGSITNNQAKSVATELANRALLYVIGQTSTTSHLQGQLEHNHQATDASSSAQNASSDASSGALGATYAPIYQDSGDPLTYTTTATRYSDRSGQFQVLRKLDPKVQLDISTKGQARFYVVKADTPFLLWNIALQHTWNTLEVYWIGIYLRPPNRSNPADAITKASSKACDALEKLISTNSIDLQAIGWVERNGDITGDINGDISRGIKD